MLSGVPNTAFTEAIAFIFRNDLQLLGIRGKKWTTIRCWISSGVAKLWV